MAAAGVALAVVAALMELGNLEEATVTLQASMLVMVDWAEHRPFLVPWFITQVVAVAVTEETPRPADLAVAAERKGAAVEMATTANLLTIQLQETQILVVAAEVAKAIIMKA